MAHHKVKGGELAEVSMIQSLLQSLYARYEPLILRVFDRLIHIRFLTEGRGNPILKAMARLLSFFPTAEVVTLERAKAKAKAKAKAVKSWMSLKRMLTVPSGDAWFAILPCLLR